MEKTKSGEILTFDLIVLNLLKNGKNPAKISKELNCSKQKIDYYIRKFKKIGLIEKKGYGVWEVKEVKISVPKILSKEIRGHAFIWTIKIPQEIKDLKEKASKIGIKMNKGQIRLFIKEHKVWIGNKNIVIYENKSFYAKNSINSRKYAVISLLEVIRALEQELCVKLKPLIFKPVKEHYGQIKNDLAKQCNREGEKLLVHDDLEGDWLWIDDSESLGELEISGKKAVVRSKQVQDWWNDHKKHNFELNTSKTLEIMNGIQQNQLIFDKNMVSHLEVLNKLGSAVDELRKEIKELKWKK